MATFHIHQDVEKENTIFPAKEKSGKSNVLQTITLTNTGVVGAKEKRPTFAVLQNARVVGSVGAAQKTVLRDVKNLKKISENDEHCFEQHKIKTTTHSVEQFQTFSVYEDKLSPSAEDIENDENVNALPANTGNIKDSRNTVDRNGYNKSFAHHDSILDSTPMSVTDVLSPMSIDRSQISLSASRIDDDSHRKIIAATPRPRNDRDRFFEVVEYQNCILQYFRDSEKKHRPKSTYMKRQPDINYSMRTILVDWLVEVAEEYNLDTETLYLAVSYIDRFLSHMSVVRAKLQLVGTAAMYIASKYEEIYPPDVGEFVFITDDTYTKAQVLRMEQIILKILSFDLCVPTSYVFINTYATLVDMPDQLKFLTQYISELSLLEGDPFLRFDPSVISSGAVALSRYILDLSIWSPDLEKVTNYHIEDLKEVFLYLCKTHLGAGVMAQQAIQEKYRSSKYHEVSKIKPVEIDDNVFDSIVKEYYQQLLVLSSADEDQEQSLDKIGAMPSSNDNVRKMISSLMFV